jgi:hypothetical protein
MTIQGYTVPMITIVVAAVFLIWAISLLAGVVSWERQPKRGGLRRTDKFAIGTAVLFAAVWVYAFMHDATSTTVRASKSTRVPCAVIGVGEKEASVKARLGDPDEIRGEEETRGPATNVWIYRDSRCAIHFFGDTVESIE